MFYIEKLPLRKRCMHTRVLERQEVSGSLQALKRRFVAETGRLPSTVILAPALHAELLAELDELSPKRGKHTARLQRYAGMDVVVDRARAPRGVILEARDGAE